MHEVYSTPAKHPLLPLLLNEIKWCNDLPNKSNKLYIGLWVTTVIIFQSVTPSRDVRAQFYSRMGLVAAASQPSQVPRENQIPIPSCESSADDDMSAKDRATLTKEKDSETTDNPVIVCEGELWVVWEEYQEKKHNEFIFI